MLIQVIRNLLSLRLRGPFAKLEPEAQVFVLQNAEIVAARFKPNERVRRLWAVYPGWHTIANLEHVLCFFGRHSEDYTPEKKEWSLSVID